MAGALGNSDLWFNGAGVKNLIILRLLRGSRHLLEKQSHLSFSFLAGRRCLFIVLCCVVVTIFVDARVVVDDHIDCVVFAKNYVFLIEHPPST